MLTIKENDINLAQNINLYIDLVNKTNDSILIEKYIFFKKYLKFKDNITKIKLLYLIILIQNLDMDYIIIVNNNMYTLFEYFIDNIKNIDNFEFKIKKSNISNNIINKYIGDLNVIYKEEIYTSDLFYILRDKVNYNKYI